MVHYGSHHSAILSIPEHVWITHVPSISSYCGIENMVFTEGINQKSHIPYELQCRSAEDGWWPAIYKRENVFHVLDSVPQNHPYLYRELKIYDLFLFPRWTSAVYFFHFQHHTLCGWVQCDLDTSTKYSLHQNVHAKAAPTLKTCLWLGCSKQV